VIGFGASFTPRTRKTARSRSASEAATSAVKLRSVLVPLSNMTVMVAGFAPGRGAGADGGEATWWLVAMSTVLSSADTTNPDPDADQP